MSPDQFLQLAELFPMAGLAETDLAGRFLRVSPRYCEIVGRTAEELCQLRMQDITHPDDLPGNLSLFEKLGHDGPPYVIEKRYVRPDGSVVWVQINVTAARHAGDRPKAALAVTVDVTKRQEVEEERRRTESLLIGQKNILEQLARGAALGDVLDAVCEAIEAQSAPGAIATVLLVDEAGTRLTFAAGRRCPEAYTEKLGAVPVGPAVGSCGTAAFRGERVVVADIAADPLWAGYQSLALGHGLRSCWSTPILSAAGKVLGTLAVYHPAPRQPEPHDLRVLDVLGRTASLAIERRRDEAELRRLTAASHRQRRLYETILNGTPDLVYVFDLSHRFTYANQALLAMWGKTWDESIGKNCLELGYPDWHAALHDREIEQVRATKRPIRGEVPFTGTSGRRVYDYIFVPVIGTDGEVEAVAGTTRDVTDRKQAEVELQSVNERMRGLLENIDEGFLVLDAEWRFVYLNTMAERINGHRREEVLGKNHWEVFPETVGTRIHRELHRVAAERVKAEFENYYEPWDRWYNIKAYPTAEGGVCFHFRDITEAKRAADQLRESEEWLRLVLDSVPQKVFTATPAGDVDYFNPQWTAFTGLPFEQIRDWGWTQFIHPDDVAENVRAWQQAVATGEPFRFEHRFRRADGEYRWHLSRAHAVRDADGRIVRWVGANTDIDDVRRAEADLRDSEERFRQFAEHSRKLFWMTDPVAGRVLYVNHGYQDIWGRTDESLYADPQSFLEGVHPDDRPRLAEAMRRQLAGEATTQEYRVARPDGSLRWVVDRAFPIRDAAGRVYRVAGIAEDITARKRIEEDMRFLAGASAALASLMDDASTLQKVARLAVPFFADWCAVDMLDADGRLRRVAVAHVDPTKVELAHELHRRYPPDPAAPQGVWNILRTGQSEMVAEITEEMITASVPDAEQLTVIRELGLRSYIGVPLVAHGRVLGAITFIAAESGRLYDASDLAVAEDLAHRAAVAVENARLYESLKESDRRKDEFLAVLAHELRNPLAPIRNALHIMKLPTATPQAIGRIRDVAERQVNHLTRLVDDLLDVSRIVRGKIELRKERVDLATIVNRAIETARPVIDAEKHEFSAAIDAAPVWLSVDPVRVAQVVANLLNNAAKYTEKGGRIRLTAGREGDAAVVRVGDTGIGLDRDMLSRIFEMFTQVAPAHARSQGGLGIGLTLVKNLVEMHGGTVTAHSEGQGRGSEFVVRLPLAPQTERAGGGAEMEHDGLTPAPNARRVLVVDDNTDAAESLAVLLRLSGHDARVANDGFAALRAAQEMRPDLILLDIGMPGMDGYEVARRLRQDAAFRDVKLVALTGWGQEEDRRRSKSAGFDAHYVKPIDPDVLEKLLD